MSLFGRDSDLFIRDTFTIYLTKGNINVKQLRSRGLEKSQNYGPLTTSKFNKVVQLQILSIQG